MTFDDSSKVSLDTFSGMAKRRSSFVPKYSYIVASETPAALLISVIVVFWKPFSAKMRKAASIIRSFLVLGRPLSVIIISSVDDDFKYIIIVVLSSIILFHSQTMK